MTVTRVIAAAGGQLASAVLSLVCLATLFTYAALRSLLLGLCNKRPAMNHLFEQVAAAPTSDIQHYAALRDCKCELIRVVTTDGFVLKMFHLTRASSPARKRRQYPVLLMHGLFQSAGVFTVCGGNSLAFKLLEAGYDVYLGNNRDGEMDSSPKRKQWDWSLDELALCDVPALVEQVLVRTGCDKLHYIGHSQGCSQAVIAFSVQDALREKIRSFSMLAPACMLGEQMTKWPLSLLTTPSERVFDIVFGRGEFIPIMNLAQAWLPPALFAWMGFVMFSFLFSWADTRWNPNHKLYFFQFTPRPQSCKSIKHWIQISRTGRLAPFGSNTPYDLDPLKRSDLTMSIFIGGKDYLVDGNMLADELELERECVDMAEAEKENRSLASLEKWNHDSAVTRANSFDNFKHGSASPTLRKRAVLKNSQNGDRRASQENLIAKDSKTPTCAPIPLPQSFETSEMNFLQRNKNVWCRHVIKDYEHLDLLWATDCDKQVYQKLLSFLQSIDE